MSPLDISLLILFVAFVGGVAGRFPFGPTSPDDLSTLFSRGERSSLWLIPVIAVGLAAALQYLRGLTAKGSRLRLGFDVVVYALAATVLATALIVRRRIPFRARSQPRAFVESEVRRDDVIIITPISVFPYAVESKSRVSILEPTRTR